MKVHIPTHLQSYVDRQSEVEAEGATLADLLTDLNRRYPGIRFRIIDEQENIREHIRLFVNGQMVKRLDRPLRPTDEVHIVAALSGG